HPLPSSQLSAGWPHEPSALHTSVVHALPSSQSAVVEQPVCTGLPLRTTIALRRLFSTQQSSTCVTTTRFVSPDFTYAARSVVPLYSHASPWMAGEQVNATRPSGSLDVTSRPSCCCHGVRDCAAASFAKKAVKRPTPSVIGRTKRMGEYPCLGEGG